MYRVILWAILLVVFAGCNSPTAKPIIYPNPELQPTAIALATHVPSPPAGIEAMTLQERVEIYTGVFNADKFLGYEDVVSVTLIPTQICEPNDSVEFFNRLVSEEVQFFINGNAVASRDSGFGYGYTPGEICVDIYPAFAQVNTRFAPGLHLVTIRIEIPTQSRTLEYTRAFQVERGSAEQESPAQLD